jgi:peptidyl-prolyl cis-trans isomerase SurA
MLYIKYIHAVVLFGILWSCAKPLPSKPIVIQDKPAIIDVPKEPALVTLGEASFTKTDLLAEFENLPSLDSSSNDALINEVIQKKLFIMEAQAMGLDTSSLFKEEVETYKRIEIQNFSEDRAMLSALAEDSYQKYQSEINASHIFIPISWYASPEDTLKVYNELMELRRYALKNDNFAILAKEWSKDPKTNMKGGSLGWFTAFHLIYPLEKAAYSTPVDSISLPVKTKAGYHLVKINDKRPNSGYAKVKHIFKYLKVDVSKEQYDKTYATLDSLKTSLESGANFDELVIKYSDDFNSRESNGMLPIFGIGTREESTFEEAAFSLQKGEVSKPVRSSSGLHLIKLIEKYKPDSREVYLKKIQPKLTTDSRAEYLQIKKFETLRKKHHLVINDEIFAQCLNYADNRILERNWKMTQNELSNFVLFSIGQNKYFVSAFMKYVEERQEYEKWRVEEKPVEIFKMLFDKYLNQQLVLAEEKSILGTNADLERLFKFQKDNLLYSKFYNKAIIQKSLDDSTGQRQFFESHPELFPNVEVGSFTVVSFADTSIQNKFKVYRAGAKPYQLNRGIKPLYYAKDQYLLGLEEKRKLTGLLTIMKKNSGYIVEIGGHVDKNEDEKVAALRIQQIVDYLVENGLPLTRILEVNYKNNKVQDRFDWTKNQRVSFQFFSNLESDLIKVFNERQAESIIYKTYTIDRKEFEKKLGLKWQNQTGVVEIAGRIEEFSLKIKKATKSFKDYKYEVIEKYQDYLTQELTKSLAQKYKVNFDKAELNKIVEAVKSNSK